MAIRRVIGLRAGGIVPSGFSDDFDDESMNDKWWEKYEVGGAWADEVGGVLDIRATTLDRSAGYVTKSLWRFGSSTTVKVDVSAGHPPGPGGPYPDVRLGIVLSMSKVTSTDVLDEYNWYFLCYETDGMSWWIKLYKRIMGSSVVECYSNAIADPAWAWHNLKIVVSAADWTIKVYEDNVELYSEVFALEYDDLHIYLIGWHGIAEPTHGYFDNFSLSSSLLLNKECKAVSIYGDYDCYVDGYDGSYDKYDGQAENFIGWGWDTHVARTAVRFPLGSVPSDAEVMYGLLIFSVLDAGGVEHQLNVYAYGEDGQDNPQADGAEDTYNRSREGIPYLEGSDVCRSVGVKLVEPTWASFIKPAKLAVNRFSAGLCEGTELFEDGHAAAGIGGVVNADPANRPILYVIYVKGL